MGGHVRLTWRGVPHTVAFRSQQTLDKEKLEAIARKLNVTAGVTCLEGDLFIAIREQIGLIQAQIESAADDIGEWLAEPGFQVPLSGDREWPWDAPLPHDLFSSRPQPSLGDPTTLPLQPTAEIRQSATL
ncbi:MAG: hypothetical protein HY460_00265 [Parcubacteria group bacterium]|nr:hypothetical protein [Parcubacteria group bacterium]